MLPIAQGGSGPAGRPASLWSLWSRGLHEPGVCVLIGSAFVPSHCEQETPPNCQCLHNPVTSKCVLLVDQSKNWWSRPGPQSEKCRGSLASKWRLQKSPEVLDSTVGHGPWALPPTTKRDGEEMGWGRRGALTILWDCMCKGACDNCAETVVKPSLGRHP